MKIKQKDQYRSYHKQDSCHGKHQFAVEPQAFKESVKRKLPLIYLLDFIPEIPPDHKSKPGHNDQPNRGKIYQWITHIRRQTVLSQHINPGITESRDGSEYCMPQSSRQSQLRHKAKCVADCSDPFCSKHTKNHSAHHTDHSIHSVQIIGLLDHTPVFQRYFFTQTYKNNTAQRNQPHSPDLDQYQNDQLSGHRPVRRRRNCHKSCYADTCGSREHGVRKRSVVSGCRTKRQPQKNPS